MRPVYKAHNGKNARTLVDEIVDNYKQECVRHLQPRIDIETSLEDRKLMFQKNTPKTTGTGEFIQRGIIGNHDDMMKAKNNQDKRELLAQTRGSSERKNA